ncbi:MAG: AarF/UbiB family protein, partial [Holophagales bacterium]|nr:AarF/UbiB family protein [Holophagales bacterium]
ERRFLRWLRSPPVPRWVGLARKYRSLAVELGGVLIKLGQYLSTRVDILPIAVTRELADLQDEVPAETFGEILAQVESELGRPIQELFSTFMERPLGAASFAQAHEAQLADGSPVVVKVLRPGIEAMVDVDLRAVGKALGWLSWWKVVRQRVDLGWVEEEFSTTTLRELDLRQEARHVERFAENFDGDGDVGIPRVFWHRTARRVLTEENVAYIKVTDVEALRANGIDPREVAKKLYRVYMRQIFEHSFVHADPHPGNIFVRPLPRDPSVIGEMRSRVSEATHAMGVDEHLGFATSGAPFQLLFVDFGMMAEIPPRLRAALRKYLMGMASRDAAAVVQALRDSGSLLPGADLAYLEEAVEALFDRFWGVDMAHIQKSGLQEVSALWREFGQLLMETPIQVQVDLMFTGRAVEILSGITKELDDAFNPWIELAPFAQKLAFQELADWRLQGQDIAQQARSLFRLPAELTRTTSMVQRGRLTVRSSMAPDTQRQMRRLERAADRAGTAVMAAALVVAGALLYPTEAQLGLGLGGAGILYYLVQRIRS